MDFRFEQRAAWVRTSTHTVITDRHREFDRFVDDPTGTVARLVRIWYRRDARALAADYLGAVCHGPAGFRQTDLLRVFRRLRDPVHRRRLKSLLRALT